MHMRVFHCILSGDGLGLRITSLCVCVCALVSTYTFMLLLRTSGIMVNFSRSSSLLAKCNFFGCAIVSYLMGQA